MKHRFTLYRAMTHVQNSSILSRALFVCILAALAATAFARNTLWEHDATIWENTVARSPFKARAHYNLGRIYQDREQLIDKALEQYRIVVALQPDHDRVHNNLGNIYLSQGREQETITEFELAVKYNPRLSFAYFTLGNLYTRQGRYADAMGNYLRALELRPASPYTHNALGVLYRPEAAVEEFQKAILLYANYDEAVRNLAYARQKIRHPR